MYIFVLMYLNLPKKSNTINEIKKKRCRIYFIDAENVSTNQRF